MQKILTFSQWINSVNECVVAKSDVDSSAAAEEIIKEPEKNR